MVPSLGIVIINWNGLADTRACLLSLSAGGLPAGTEVVVVDNGSSDGSVAALRREFAWVTVLDLGRNAGFAGGNNAGIRHLLERGAQYILLLNNDTLVDPGMIVAFQRAAAEHPDIAAFGGKIYCMDVRDVLWFAGGNNVPGSPAGPTHRGECEPDRGQYDQPWECSFLTGCLVFARAAAFQTAGLLDEELFFLWEDVDWCVRCTRAGLRLMYVPTARIWHKGSASTGGKAAPVLQYYYERNRLYLIRRFCRPQLARDLVRRLTVLARDIVGAAVRALLRRPQALGPWPALWRRWCARFLGIADFARGRGGPVPQAYGRLLSVRRQRPSAQPAACGSPPRP